ncbi:MAG: cell division protein FtsA [Sporomusaceae bacterium]|nr:cell division protein FtsA [Sporomusaceae bacterium]
MVNRNVLGIDVGTSHIKVFIGKIDSDGRVLIAGSGTAPTIGFLKGVITDVEALAQSISQAVDCAIMATNISIKDAYIGIGGVEISSVSSIGSVAPSSTDVITHEDINRLYKAAVLTGVSDDHEVLHLLPKKFFVDKKRQVELSLQQKCTHLELEAHIITMSKSTVHKLINALESLGINVVGIVANSIVATQLLPTADKQNYLFMDVGAGTTELTLYRDRQIYLSTSLPLGGDYITNDIMKGLSISHNHAEEVKKYYAKLDSNLRGQNIILDCNDYGTTDKQISYDFLNEIIESRIDEIVFLVYDYVKEIIAAEKIEKILLDGGFGAMANFSDSVERIFGLPVEVVALQELPAEYASPSNITCYGVLTYAANNIADMPRTNNNPWRSLVSKFKKFFIR